MTPSFAGQIKHDEVSQFLLGLNYFAFIEAKWSNFEMLQHFIYS